MTNDDYCDRLYEVRYVAGVNAQYHQQCEAWYAWADRAVRVSVAALAVIAAVLAVPPLDLLWWAFAAAGRPPCWPWP